MDRPQLSVSMAAPQNRSCASQQEEWQSCRAIPHQLWAQLSLTVMNGNSCFRAHSARVNISVNQTQGTVFWLFRGQNPPVRLLFFCAFTQKYWFSWRTESLWECFTSLNQVSLMFSRISCFLDKQQHGVIPAVPAVTETLWQRWQWQQ